MRFRGGENLEIISKDYLFLLASGCSGCNGDGIYATITKVLFNANWYDEVNEVYFEGELPDGKVSEAYNHTLTVYADRGHLSPKIISADKFEYAIDPSVGLLVSDAGVISGTPTATGDVTVTATAKDNASLVATGTITVTA